MERVHDGKIPLNCHGKCKVHTPNTACVPNAEDNWQDFGVDKAFVPQWDGGKAKDGLTCQQIDEVKDWEIDEKNVEMWPQSRSEKVPPIRGVTITNKFTNLSSTMTATTFDTSPNMVTQVSRTPWKMKWMSIPSGFIWLPTVLSLYRWHCRRIGYWFHSNFLSSIYCDATLITRSLLIHPVWFIRNTLGPLRIFWNLRANFTILWLILRLSALYFVFLWD